MSFQQVPPWIPTQVPEWWKSPVTDEGTEAATDWLEDYYLSKGDVETPSMPENKGPLPDKGDLPGGFANQLKVGLGNLIATPLTNLANVSQYNAMQQAMYPGLQSAGIQATLNPYSADLLYQSTPKGRAEVDLLKQSQVASSQLAQAELNKSAAAMMTASKAYAPGTVRSYYNPYTSV